MKLDVCLLLFMNLLSAIGYSIVAPLFPLLGQKDHLSELIIGTLIYAYFFRALHGFGAGTVAIIVYSLVNSISEKEEAQLALGYLELVWSCGVALGPIISSFFYYLGGYSLPFYFVSVLLAVSVYFVRVLKVVDSEDKGKKEGDNDGKDRENNLETHDAETSPTTKLNSSLLSESSSLSSLKEIGNFFDYFSDSDTVVSLIAVLLNIIGLTFFFPSLTNHLMKNFGLSVSSSSLFFAIGMGSTFVVLNFLNHIIRVLGLYGTSALGILMIAVGDFCVYPVNPLPQSLIIIISGLAISGGSSAPLNVPAVLILDEILSNSHPKLHKFIVSDIASTLYNVGISLGDFLGPILGGYISDNFGFKSSCLFISGVSFGFFVVYVWYFWGRITEALEREEGKRRAEEIKEQYLEEEQNLSYKNHSYISSDKIEIKRVEMNDLN